MDCQGPNPRWVAKAGRNWSRDFAEKGLGIQKEAQNLRLQGPGACAIFNRYFKMEIPAKQLEILRTWLQTSVSVLRSLLCNSEMDINEKRKFFYLH
jgi:hypothetical protein